MTMTDPSPPRTPAILDEEHQLSDPKQVRRRRREEAEKEGHAGSSPRGNPESEHQEIGRRREEYEKVLGH
jgi:hypothetical protein